MGRHRDNFQSSDLFDAVMSDRDVFKGKQGYSQTPRSDVLVYSEGNLTMDVWLSFPVTLTEAHILERKTYVCPPKYRVPCGPGTLLVFTFWDDLHFCHEARLMEGAAEGPPAVRLAFAYRWLQVARIFHARPDMLHAIKCQ